MLEDFLVRKNDQGFYLMYDTETMDDSLAKLCGISLTKYKCILQSEYEAILLTKYKQIYFKSKEQAEKALEWLESMILIEKLSKCK